MSEIDRLPAIEKAFSSYHGALSRDAEKWLIDQLKACREEHKPAQGADSWYSDVEHRTKEACKKAIIDDSHEDSYGNKQIDIHVALDSIDDCKVEP